MVMEVEVVAVVGGWMEWRGNNLQNNYEPAKLEY
jgi:hypothetical protein